MEIGTNEPRICTDATDTHRFRSVLLRCNRANPRFILCLLLLACLNGNAIAQDAPETQDELWPEVDLYVTLNLKWRLFFLANVARERETDIDREAQVGANADYLVNKHLVIRSGYRYGFSLDDDEPYQEQRIIFEQTFRVTIPWKILLSDRNRQELRWVNGSFSARYRNRLQLERDFAIKYIKFTAYGSAEAYYDFRYDTFNRTRFEGGVVLPLRKSIDLDIYYARQNDSRSTPNHVNAIGITLVFTLRNR